MMRSRVLCSTRPEIVLVGRGGDGPSPVASVNGDGAWCNPGTSFTEQNGNILYSFRTYAVARKQNY